MPCAFAPSNVPFQLALYITPDPTSTCIAGYILHIKTVSLSSGSSIIFEAILVFALVQCKLKQVSQTQNWCHMQQLTRVVIESSMP